jgi:hypothetical protein
VLRGVLIPLMRRTSKLGAPQCEIICRVCKDCFSKQLCVRALAEFVALLPAATQQPWTEYTIKVFTALINMKLKLEASLSSSASGSSSSSVSSGGSGYERNLLSAEQLTQRLVTSWHAAVIIATPPASSSSSSLLSSESKQQAAAAVARRRKSAALLLKSVKFTAMLLHFAAHYALSAAQTAMLTAVAHKSNTFLKRSLLKTLAKKSKKKK